MFTDLVGRGNKLLAKHGIDPDGVLLIEANGDGYLWRPAPGVHPQRLSWPSDEAREDFRPLFGIK